MTYLERLRAVKSEKARPPRTDETDKTPTGIGSVSFVGPWGARFSEISHPFAHLLEVLESGRPNLVPVARWQLAVEDARRFLTQWGDQAVALGWTTKDLFGLLTVPQHAKPTFNRLSRYDETGLIWLLKGRRVVALTESTAAIENPASGAVTMYRRFDKPALGPLGDSLEDFTGGLR